MSMYRITLPSFIHALNSLNRILDKAIAFSEQKNIDSIVLVNTRLAPDMLPLANQIQIACDTAKGCGARLSGVEAPKYEDNEKTITELKERIDKTIAFLKSLEPTQIDGTEEKRVELKFPSFTMEFSGMDYVNQFALPNFYFHMTTAYNILRHCGVELGKRDFLGAA